MKLYIIGSVSGMPNRNLATFNAVRGELMIAGHKAVIPHDSIGADWSWSKAMSRSIQSICSQSDIHGDNFGIAMLDGWEQSKGATIEHDLAVALGIPCKPWKEWL